MSYTSNPSDGAGRDQEIAARVRTMIDDEAQLTIESLHVDCNGGVVRLGGQADTASDSDRAAMCAQGPPDVLDVVNEIVVRKAAPAADGAPDGWKENF